MKYIVIELQKNAVGAVSNIVTSHENLADAESKFYTILAGTTISEVPVHSAVLVSEESFTVRSQCYKH